MKMADARARRQLIARWRDEGKTMDEIAEALAVTKQRIQQIIANMTCPRDSSYVPERTRLTRMAVVKCHAGLTDKPQALFLRIGPNDWSICMHRYADARPIGTFSSEISIDELHNEIEFVADEMARDLMRRRIAA